MTLDVWAVHVLGVNSDVTLTDERLAQQRAVPIPHGELALGFLVGFGTHVYGTTDDHFPEHVTFDECPSLEPCRQRSRYRRLAGCLSADHQYSARSCLHEPIIALGQSSAAKSSKASTTTAQPKAVSESTATKRQLPSRSARLERTARRR